MDAICLVCESAFGMEGKLPISSIPVNLQLECPNCQMGILVFDDEEHDHTASKSLFKPIATEVLDEEGAAILAAPPTSPGFGTEEEDTIPTSSVKDTFLSPPSESSREKDNRSPQKTKTKTDDILAGFTSQPLELADFDPLVPGSATLHAPEDLTRTLPTLHTINSQLTKALTPEKPLATGSSATLSTAETKKHEPKQDPRDTLESSPSFDHTPGSSKGTAWTTEPDMPPITAPASWSGSAKKTSSKPVDPALEALASQLDSAIATSFLDDPLFAPSSRRSPVPSTVLPMAQAAKTPPPAPPKPEHAVLATIPTAPVESDPGEISMVTPLTSIDMLAEEEPLLGADGMETLTVSDALSDEKIATPQVSPQGTTPASGKIVVEAEEDVVIPPEPRMLPTPPPMEAVVIARQERASSPSLEAPRFVMAPPSGEEPAPVLPPVAPKDQAEQPVSPTVSVATQASTPVPQKETASAAQAAVSTSDSHEDSDDMDLDLAKPVVASKEDLRAASASMEIPAVPFGPALPAANPSIATESSPGATLPLFSAEAVKQFIQKQETPPSAPVAPQEKAAKSTDPHVAQEQPATPVAQVAEPALAEPPSGKATPSSMKKTGELASSAQSTMKRSGEIPRSPGMIDFDAFSQEFFEAPARDPDAEHEEELFALLKQQQEESRRIIRRILIFTPVILVSVVLMFWGINYTMTRDKSTTPVSQPRQITPRQKPDTRQPARQLATAPHTTTPGKTSPTPIPATVRVPEVRRDTPEARRDTPEVRRDTPEARRDTPEERRDVPEVRRDTPEVRRDTPEERRDVPETRRDAPEVRTAPVARRDDDEEGSKKSVAKKTDQEDDGDEDEGDEDETPARVEKRQAPPRRVVRRRVRKVAMTRPRPRPRARKSTRDPAAAQKLYMAGIQSFGSGQLKQAEGKLKQAIQANPGHADAHRILGMTYMRMGNNGKAKQHLNTFLRLAPNHPVAGMIRSVVGQLK